MQPAKYWQKLAIYSCKTKEYALFTTLVWWKKDTLKTPPQVQTGVGLQLAEGPPLFPGRFGMFLKLELLDRAWPISPNHFQGLCGCGAFWLITSHMLDWSEFSMFAWKATRRRTQYILISFPRRVYSKFNSNFSVFAYGTLQPPDHLHREYSLLGRWFQGKNWEELVLDELYLPVD